MDLTPLLLQYLIAYLINSYSSELLTFALSGQTSDAGKIFAIVLALRSLSMLGWGSGV